MSAESVAALVKNIGRAGQGEDMYLRRKGGRVPEIDIGRATDLAVMGIDAHIFDAQSGSFEDSIGIAFAYAQLTQGARHAAIVSGSTGVGAEMDLEVTYQAQITRWLSIQPDLQFVINPGVNQDLKNALVIGLRTVVTF
jgi:Carbohydrate-selective porin, OprB family